MRGLKNRDLQFFGEKIIGKSFLGVFSSDLCPSNVKRKNFFVIFNLSKHYQKGSHFVAVAKIRKKIFYFDPLGKKCSNIGILKFLLKTKSKITFNNLKIQSDQSIFCGFFCLSFLMHMSKNKSLSSFLKLFSFTNLNDNDNISSNYILNEIND